MNNATSTRIPIWHPLLLAIFPVLALYASNVSSLPPSAMFRPLLLAVGGSLLLWGVIAVMVRHASKSAVIASLIIIAFWSAESVARGVLKLLQPIVFVKYRYTLLVMLALGVAVVWRVARARGDLRRATQIMNRLSLALVLVPLFMATPTAMRALTRGLASGDASHAPHADSLNLTRPAASTDAPPDIYHIILDAYGRSEFLESHFDYSGGLAQTLPNLGFYVASRAKSNFTTTCHSVPTALNMDFVHNLLQQDAATPTKRQLRNLVRDNALVRFLRPLGYKFIAYSTGFYFTECPDADEYIRVRSSLTEFESAVLNLTLFPRTRLGRRWFSAYQQHRDRVLTCLHDLPRIAEDPAPTYVLAHFVCPHPPFVFDEVGGDVSTYDYPFAWNRGVWRDNRPTVPYQVHAVYREGYRRQIAFLDKKLFETVSAILARSPRPPIIIIHGDHGPRGYRSEGPNVMAYAILNAYHLPNGGEAALYPEISPVNSFRVVLNHYFGQHLPLLPDNQYVASYEEPDIIRPVTIVDDAEAARRVAPPK